MESFELTLTGHITPVDKARSDYFYVPFDLPAPAARLHARYEYSAAMSAALIEGGNVIDIGLFDPRGSEFPGGQGFRGWSGSARNEFYITITEATPGYLPGPLPAGRYQLILGLYRIWPAGADYTIRISADINESLSESYAPNHQQQSAAHTIHDTADRSLLWLRGDLQSHTCHSDARGTIAQLVRKAGALGLDFLAITDHNTVSHHPFLPDYSADDLLLIPGQESTTYYGHMNIWGTSRWCDFRCRSSADMAKVIALAHESGAICSINHPKASGPAWEYGNDLPVDAMEVWQGPWANRNGESLARWDRLLLARSHLPGVGGSDYHCPAGADSGFLRLGQPTTWVKVDQRSVAGVLDAIRHGRASISYMPDGPRLDLRVHAGSAMAEMGETVAVARDEAIEVAVEVERGTGWKLRIVADGGIACEAPITESYATHACTIQATRYVRAELVGDAPHEILPADTPADIALREWRWALSNPVYIAASARH